MAYWIIIYIYYIKLKNSWQHILIYPKTTPNVHNGTQTVVDGIPQYELRIKRTMKSDAGDYQKVVVRSKCCFYLIFFSKLLTFNNTYSTVL